MARFTAIPNIPTSGIEYWQSQLFSAFKENIELVTGTGGELNGESRAVTKGDITVEPARGNMTQVTAVGAGFTIAGEQVASLSDFGKLIGDVQNLANDVAALRDVVNELIMQLKR